MHPINTPDVYLFGHISTGTVLRLRDPFPKPDGYGEIIETQENHAGEATGSALVLARLGRSVVLEGNWIGDTPACRRTLAFLQSRGIDCTGLRVQSGYPGVNEIVVSDGATRTVFGRYCDLLFTTPQWDAPNLQRLAQARAVCVDPSFGEATLAVARAARTQGKLLASCDAHPESELAAKCDLLVISNEYLHREFPKAVEEGQARRLLFERYCASCPGLVVFTAGSRPLWYGRGTSKRGEHPPFRITVKDSAGAGDSFRGAMIDGLLAGWPDEECIRHASAVAALVCLSSPGCVNSPTRGEVQVFMETAGRL